MDSPLAILASRKRSVHFDLDVDDSTIILRSVWTMRALFHGTGASHGIYSPPTPNPKTSREIAYMTVVPYSRVLNSPHRSPIAGSAAEARDRQLGVGISCFSTRYSPTSAVQTGSAYGIFALCRREVKERQLRVATRYSSTCSW